MLISSYWHGRNRLKHRALIEIDLMWFLIVRKLPQNIERSARIVHLWRADNQSSFILVVCDHSLGASII
nr:MAG TPA: hypothetical protein [Caudoviricetes sp.]